MSPESLRPRPSPPRPPPCARRSRGGRVTARSPPPSAYDMYCRCRRREPGTCGSLGRKGATGRSLGGYRPTVKRRLLDLHGAPAKNLGDTRYDADDGGRDSGKLPTVDTDIVRL